MTHSVQRHQKTISILFTFPYKPADLHIRGYSCELLYDRDSCDSWDISQALMTVKSLMTDFIPWQRAYLAGLNLERFFVSLHLSQTLTMYQSVAVFVKSMYGLYRRGKYCLACTYCGTAWQNEAFKGTAHPKVNYSSTGNNILKENYIISKKANLEYHTPRWAPYIVLITHVYCCRIYFKRPLNFMNY